MDKEELRADKAVKVSRKELNNLVAELFSFADDFSREQNASNSIAEQSQINVSTDLSHTTLQL